MRKLSFIIVVSLLLSACASSSKVSQPIADNAALSKYYSDIEIKNNGTPAPSHFLVAVESYLKQQLINQSMYSEENGNKIEIAVTSYRMRSGFSRAMFGVFAGKDGIDSVVSVVNAKTGETIGRSTVSSYNLMAIGGMEDIAKMHAEEIAKFLNTAGS